MGDAGPADRRQAKPRSARQRPVGLRAVGDCEPRELEGPLQGEGRGCEEILRRATGHRGAASARWGAGRTGTLKRCSRRLAG